LTRSLLLPVETLNREFDGKLLLALHAAQRGWQTTVGKRSTLHDNLQRFPRSVYFSKDLRANNRKMFPILAGLGHTIVGLDEEGLVNASDEMFLLKMDAGVLGYFSAAFAWGENDARIYRQFEAAIPPPIIVTGNPRVDMLRPELSGYFADEIEKIRQQHGRFALINTNFAMVNHFIANQNRFKVADWVDADTASQMQSGMLGHKATLLDAFLKLLPPLAAALHPHPLIIRPHPSENHQTWKDAAPGLENVHVIHDGNVASWLAAASILIHNGCTSAIEAAIIGTPALSYRPVKSAGFDNDLPNGLSDEMETADALIPAVAQAVGKSDGARYQLDPARRAYLERHIAALDGPLGCERLMDEIERCANPKDASNPGLARDLAARARLAVRTPYRRIRKRSATAKGNPVYLRHKFPGISLAEVNDRIARLSAALGKFEGFTAEELLPDLFQIMPSPGRD
jgi:surface carbohydrate biosynthesis protein